MIQTSIDRIEDRIVELLRTQRSNGENLPKWEVLSPGECCLCGRGGTAPEPAPKPKQKRKPQNQTEVPSHG